LKPEYDRLKAQLEKASDSSTLSFSKKKTVSAEVKAFKDQAAEAERHNKLAAKRDKLRKIEMLWRMWHAEKQIDGVREEMAREQEKIAATGKEGALHLVEAELKKAKKEYAKINKQVLVSEKMAKDKERERLDLVSSLLYCYVLAFCSMAILNAHSLSFPVETSSLHKPRISPSFAKETKDFRGKPSRCSGKFGKAGKKFVGLEKGIGSS
jgi:hypothetical protein